MIEVQLRYIPTGNVFKIPQKDAQEILQKDRGNYEIVGAENTPPAKEDSTFKKVTGDEEPKVNLKDCNYNELKKYCKENDLDTSGNTDKLRTRALEFEEKQNELIKLRNKLTQYTGKTADEKATAEQIEADIINALVKKIKEANKEIKINQSPVTIEYLEEILETKE